MKKEVNNEVEKGLVSVAREAYYRYYKHSLMFQTDPVRDYGVEYTIEEDVWSKGGYVTAVYGMTEQKVPLWKVLINKKASVMTVGMNDSFFILGNLVAFYQIHRKQFDADKATDRERQWALAWFAQYIQNWNTTRGIELHLVTRTGQTWIEYSVQKAWEYRDLNIYSEEASHFDIFFSMTDIFPGNEVGRRALIHSKARFAFHTSITLVREAMSLNDGLVTNRLVSEYNSIMIPLGTPQKVIEDKKLHKGAGFRVLTNYSAEDYYANTIELSKKDRTVLRVMDALDRFKPKSVAELSRYLEESEYVTHKMLDIVGPGALLELKNGWLLKLAQQCGSRVELERRSGLSRTTLARRAKKDDKLGEIWKQL